jgi:hypothetical protein
MAQAAYSTLAHKAKLIEAIGKNSTSHTASRLLLLEVEAISGSFLHVLSFCGIILASLDVDFATFSGTSRRLRSNRSRQTKQKNNTY